MESFVPALAALAMGFLVSLGATPVLAAAARRAEIVSAPQPDRWSGRPTPMLGGLALVAGTLAPVVLNAGADPRLGVVAAGTLSAMCLGLIDDMRRLRPTSKIVGQVAIASGLAIGGVHVEIVEFQPLAFALTLLWVVGVMNAMNLVDNMDGLAAGLAAIAAIVLVLMAPAEPMWVRLLAAALAGACAGFLVYNFAPARVYMGDAGSLALGFVLAALALLQTNTAASGVGLALLGPLLVLGLPIYDTALVTIVRRIEGRPVSRGGRDHTSHRLAARGLSDRETVLLLYAIAACLALVGLLADAFGLALLPLIGLVIIGLVLFGIFLTDSPGQPASELAGRSRVIGAGRVLVRYGGEIALDVALATIALFSAFLVRFETLSVTAWLRPFLDAAPIVVPIQLAAFVLLGVYRTLWSHLGVTDMFAIIRASVAGTFAASVLLLYGLGRVDQSRAVLVLDGVLLAALVIASRAFLLWLRHWSALRPRVGDRRVLIVGANDTGELALRLMLKSRETAYHPAGFLDDDSGKQRRRIAGVSVLGRIADLDAVARRQSADLVVVAIDEDNGEERERIHETCRRLGLESRDFRRTL